MNTARVGILARESQVTYVVKVGEVGRGVEAIHRFTGDGDELIGSLRSPVCRLAEGSFLPVVSGLACSI
jgi:hypothetical protein